MAVVIDLWEWKQERGRLGGRKRPPICRRPRARRAGERAPSSIGDLSAELLALLREE